MTTVRGPWSGSGHWEFGLGTTYPAGDYVYPNGRRVEAIFNLKTLMKSSGLIVIQDDPDLLLPDGI